MKNIENAIKENNLIKSGETIGVACSGGKDSMALLHYLNENKDNLGISICAVNIDHSIRQNSKNDSAFVVSYCNRNNIKVLSYKVNVLGLCEKEKLSVEQGAREARFRIFKSLIKNNVVSKIALAHHLQDQAETILLHVFRGSGLNGASGMEFNKDNMFIRPMLTTSKTEINAYIEKNDIPYVEDETNQQNEYARNYIRNMIMPLIRNKWPNADNAICNFGKICGQDDKYICNQIDKNAVEINNGIAQIKLYYFAADDAIVNRILLRALKGINATQDVEKKHFKMIQQMALEAQNGTKINLPNNICVIKEYNFITITNKKFKQTNETWQVEKGRKDVPNFGMIETFVTRKIELNKYNHIIDYNKLPKDAVWRNREDGDVFEKFGGGTNSLSDYLIDKKVPKRLRDITPVLALGNEVFVIAGIEISDKVKIDKSTSTAYAFNVIKF